MSARVVVLLSGGVDSSACCLYFRLQGWDVYPFFVDYGQRAAESEWLAAISVADSLALRTPFKVTVPEVGQLYPSLLTTASEHVPRNLISSNIREYFPYRNLLLVTLASIHAVRHHVQSVGIGLIDTGESSYPDTRPDYLEALNKLVECERPVTVVAPFIQLTKHEVVAYCHEHNFDISLTYSCSYRPGTHCGHCSSCQSRFSAVAE